MNPKEVLTIGIAIYREPLIWPTLEALHANHPHVSYLVIDNAPEVDQEALSTCLNIGGMYTHRPDLNGTSKPRDALFRLAKTPWVMSIDSHIILESGALRCLLDYIEAHFNSKDLLTGPMIADDGNTILTQWRPEESAKPGYWGVWDTAWVTPKGQAFCVWSINGLPSFRDLEGNEISPPTGVNPHNPAENGCVKAGRDLEMLDYWRGEYMSTPSTARPSACKEYEIPSNGLGLFAMRKDAWPGFHPLFRGFGGEEGYVHEKVRRAGGKCLSLPHLGWRHKFRNQGGTKENPINPQPTPYPLRLGDHTFNLIVGHRELGIECDKQMWEHFGKRLPGGQQEWNALLEEGKRVQPFNQPFKRKRMNILGIWYTNNRADPKLLAASLRTIQRAVNEAMFHNVKITTAAWEEVVLFHPDGRKEKVNPFPCHLGKPLAPAGHASIAASMRNCINLAKDYEWDAVCFLEHDVLYPAWYFDRMGDAVADGGKIVVNLDYEGLNNTGWLRTINRHEPMHQMCMVREEALKNLARAEDECQRNGGCLLEPDSLLPCDRQSKEGLLAVDFDGTLTNGYVPYFDDFVVITGRTAKEAAEVTKVAGGKSVYYRPESVPATSEGVASHKVKTIKLLEVVEHWEDDPTQVKIIQRECPGVIVHHVQGPPQQPDRSHWARLPASANEQSKFGLYPSIHVNTESVFTGHAAVCYEQKSTLGTFHPAWGHAGQWHPGQVAGGNNVPCPSCGGGGQQSIPPPPSFKSLEEWVTYSTNNPSDFHEHVPLLTELAAKCDVCVEMGIWGKPSLPALLAGKPKVLISIHPGGKEQQWETAKAVLQPPTEFRTIGGQTALQTEPIPNDLFFHDRNHEDAVLWEDLKRWGPVCRRYIVVHTTDIYGEKGDLGGPGVRHAIRRWVREHSEWTVVVNRKNNYGLMVLSKDERDKHKTPGVVKLALNYAKATWKHKMNGGTYLPLPLVKERFNECAVCDQHTNGRCADCGCWLTILPDDAPVAAGQPGKLWYPVEFCPLGKWPAQPDKGVAMTTEQIQKQVEEWDE